MVSGGTHQRTFGHSHDARGCRSPAEPDITYTRRGADRIAVAAGHHEKDHMAQQ